MGPKPSTVAQLAARAQQISDEDGTNGNGVPGLTIYRADQPTEIDALIYQPIVCLILQGAKKTTVGDCTVSVRTGECVVVSHELPVLAQITEASKRKPYLALIVRLDLAVLRSLYDELEGMGFSSASPRSYEVAPVDEATLRVLDRYLDLRDRPEEAGVLLPLIRKELHFRLLASASGGMLRALLQRDSHASHITRAIHSLRENFKRSLDVASLARSVGMSASSFHKHFKSMTQTTPLQYQKDLRLTEARRMLRSGEWSVSTTAFDVGYESASQFSREYSRKFGISPRAELDAS